MPRPPVDIPAVGSPVIRQRRRRALAAGKPATGYAAVWYGAALDIRRQMFAEFPGWDVYGQGVTAAILRAMHRLVREADEPDPVGVLFELVAGYHPGHNPVAFLNARLAERLGLAPGAVELGAFDPVAGL